jgi:hypothetical protein
MRVFKFVFFGGLILTCILGFVFPNPHPHFWWEYVPVYDALFGFLGCLLIILLAKTLGRFWLQKREDYYD